MYIKIGHLMNVLFFVNIIGGLTYHPQVVINNTVTSKSGLILKAEFCGAS